MGTNKADIERIINMLRITDERPYPFADKRYIEAFALSTDTKPTEGILTGSCIIEVNTGKAYLFDEASSTWKEQ